MGDITLRLLELKWHTSRDIGSVLMTKLTAMMLVALFCYLKFMGKFLLTAEILQDPLELPKFHGTASKSDILFQGKYHYSVKNGLMCKFYN